MDNEIVGLLFLIYFIGWTALAIISTVHIRLCKIDEDKRKWELRYGIAIGLFVTGMGAVVLTIWKQYIGVAVWLLAGTFIMFMNIRNLKRQIQSTDPIYIDPDLRRHFSDSQSANAALREYLSLKTRSP